MPNITVSRVRLANGDCLEKLKKLPDNSLDSLVTDPPAGISFMGKEWDDDKGGRKQWVAWMTEVMTECLRVLKPGAHGLVWALPRTSHWTATALEDAGFEVRDVVTHLFGTGFPKSLNIGLAIDKANGSPNRGKATLNIKGQMTERDDRDYTAKGVTYETTSDDAKQWSGWGTALKPASEHWILVRKPCSEKTVAANVLRWNTGGLNIDASRIGTEVLPAQTAGQAKIGTFERTNMVTPERVGRFPANLVLDEVAAEMLDEQSGANNSRFFHIHKEMECVQSESLRAQLATLTSKQDEALQSFVLEAVRTSCNSDPLLSLCLDSIPDSKRCTLYRDLVSLVESKESIDTTAITRSLLKLSGSVPPVTDKSTKSVKSEAKANTESDQMRFVYQSKASKSDKGTDNTHPTVKSTALMTYLIKLVTPPNGTVLDPFMGSGSTGVAAVGLGFQFVGIEQSFEYYQISVNRLKKAKEDYIEPLAELTEVS